MAKSTPTEPRTRRSRAELKEFLVDAGLELLSAQTGPVKVEALNYKSVFDLVEQTHGFKVTHASVHERIWPNQQAFQVELLCRAADGLPTDSYMTGTGAAVTVIGSADLESPDGRRRALRELIRVTFNGELPGLDSTLSIYRAIRQALAQMSPDDPDYDQVKESVDAAQVGLAERYTDMTIQMAAIIGIQPQSELGADLQTLAGWLFAQLVALADGFRLEPVENCRVTMPTGPKGADQDWHLYSWAVWSVARSLVELDGDLPEHDRRI